MRIKVLQAYQFAARAHAGQKRKYTGEDYIEHPRAVAKAMMATQYCSEFAVIVALLHDTIEDTKETYNTIALEFGVDVADGVFWLSDPKLPHLNRAARKELTKIRLKEAPALIQTIKVADLIDNMSSIVQYDPNFAPVFVREKYELLTEALTKADPQLRDSALAMIEHYRKSKK